MRRSLLVLLVGMLVMSLTGPLMASEITIKHWLVGSEPSSTLYLGIAQRFEQLHPNVEIELEHIPVGSMAEKVMLAIASDMTPDVLREYIGRVGSYWYAGALESLNGTLSEEDLEDSIPTVMDICTADGHLFAYPAPFGARTFGANMTILKRAGVANLVPSGENLEWSVEAFEQAMEKVSQLEGIYGTGFFAGTPFGDYHTLGLFQMFGAYLYQNGDYTKTTLNSEAGVRALEWMNDMVDRGIVAPGPAGTVDDHHVEAFWSGKYGFGGWVRSVEQAKVDYESGLSDYMIEYRLLEFPHVEGVTAPPVFIGPDVICVFKGSENKEMAIEWAKFQFSRKEMQRLQDGMPFGIPSRKSVKVNRDITLIAALQRIIVKNGVGDLGFISPFYQEVRSLFYPEMQAAYARIKTPKQALDDFANGILDLWAKGK